MDRLRQNRKTIQSKHLSRLYTRTPTLHRLIYGPRRGAITSGRVMPTVRSASRMRLFKHPACFGPVSLTVVSGSFLTERMK